MGVGVGVADCAGAEEAGAEELLAGAAELLALLPLELPVLLLPQML